MSEPDTQSVAPAPQVKPAAEAQEVKPVEEKPLEVKPLEEPKERPQPKKFEGAPMNLLLKPVVDEEVELEKEDEMLDVEEAGLDGEENGSMDEGEKGGGISVEPVPQADALKSHWNKMLDVVFESMPSVHSPLKDLPPDIVDNVMHIVVASSIQQKSISQKSREILNYFQKNYNPAITDVEVVISATAETKKVIYDNHDKFDYLKKENPSLQDFMNELGAKIST